MGASSMTLTDEQVYELQCGELEGFTVLENSIVGRRRWSLQHRLVFRTNGELWAFFYNTPATENQDVDQPETVNCFPVEEYATVGYRRI